MHHVPDGPEGLGAIVVGKRENVGRIAGAIRRRKQARLRVFQFEMDLGTFVDMTIGDG